MKNTYTPVIGLEVHVELNTKSKMFCGCANDYFGQKPNTRTCPVCLGLPGALPVPNRKAVESCVKIGMALNCHIPLASKFDRKNYFYPDLAKGYQISQFDEPFAEHGYITLSNGKKIGIRRAHMEEDTGKLIHETVDGKRVTLIDFNRSGVPLVEIVTEPDFETALEVKEYLQKLQQIVRYLGVANADMEKGEMRLEPNISLRPSAGSGKKDSSMSEQSESKGKSFELPNYKVEVKNINSFSFVEKAINYEIERQAALLDKGETPKQETMGWDEAKKATVVQRSKEEAADYRYFPEPDIPPIHWTEEKLAEFRNELPELSDAKQARFEKEYSLSPYNAEILTRDSALADYFEEAVKVADTIRHPELRRFGEASTESGVSGSESVILSETKDLASSTDSSLVEQATSSLRSSGPQNDISPTKLANTIINKKVDIEKVLPAALVKDIVEASKVETIDTAQLTHVITEVFAENEKAVADYKAGKETIFMFLFGQTMKKLATKIDPQLLKDKLLEELKK